MKLSSSASVFSVRSACAVGMACAAGLALTVGLGLGLSAGTARADSAPKSQDEVDVVEHLGARVPKELELRDGEGRAVRLSDVLKGDKPVLLVTAYYRCPMLCGLVLKGVATAVGKIGWTAGDQYRVVTISFDPDDTPEQGALRQRATLALAEGAADAKSWPFWTGRSEEIAVLLQSLGVKLVRDPVTKQYAHPAVAFVLTPEGKISRYLYGIEPRPLDLKLALVEAAAGKTGTTTDRMLLRCFQYDPATRRYGLFITRYFRTGGLLLLGALTFLIVRLLRHEARITGPRTVRTEP